VLLNSEQARRKRAANQEEGMTQSQLEQQSQGKGKTIKRVTNVDIIRRSGGSQYEFELTLDGTQEFVMQVPVDEVSTVQRSFQHSENVYFDTEKQDLIFEHYH
jgi:malate synthase